MQLKNYLKSKMHLISVLSLLFGLASCGSYQYVGQDDDGIYGTTERTVDYQEIVEHQEEPDAQNSNYYQNYFKQLSQDDMVFTDIDAYEGEYDEENDSIAYQDSYVGWGEDNSDITININGGYGYNSMRWNNHFYPYSYWNYGNIYSFNSYWDPMYYGSYWDRPFWSNRYYGMPYYGYGYGYGYGYYYGNYHNNYYNRNYSSRRLAYNSGRRGSIYSNSNIVGITNREGVVSRNTNRRSSTRTNTNTTNSRSNATTNTRRSNDRDLGNTTSRRTVNSRPRTTTTRPRTTTSRPRTTTNRPRTTTTNRPRTTATPRSNTTRSRSTTSSSRSNNRSSSYKPSSSRSSSNARSTSSSTRSSSSSRSSGRSNSSRKGNNI